MTLRTFDELQTRELALTVICPTCRAAGGDPCTTTDLVGVKHELAHFPAHLPRIKAAKAAASAPADGRTGSGR